MDDFISTSLQEPRPNISATPLRLRDPRSIPPREWIYGKHYIRQFISATVAPGGVGKSSLSIVEALAIATGQPLLGIKPNERARVWLWNGEDPMDELERRIGAAMLHYNIGPEELDGWLFLDSGRTSEMIFATQTRDGAMLAQLAIEAVERTIRNNQIGVVILDPFVSVHRVTENDNGMIDMVAKAIAGIADRVGCAFDLIHHVRKTNGAEVTVEDGRGATALVNATRCARSINQMTQDCGPRRIGRLFVGPLARGGSGEPRVLRQAGLQPYGHRTEDRRDRGVARAGPGGRGSVPRVAPPRPRLAGRPA